MRIAELALYDATLTASTPTLTTRGRVTTFREVFLKLTTGEGLVGWGSAAPKWYLTGESPESMATAICTTLAPILTDHKFVSPDALHFEMDRSLRRNEAAKAAVDLAVHDLLAKSAGMPLYEYLGGPRSVDLSGFDVVFLGSVAAGTEQAETRAREGFRDLKVKADADHRAAVDRLRAIRAAVGASVRLTVDPNQAWTVSQTLEISDQLRDIGVEMIEQPVPADDIGSLMEIQRKSSVPIVADESVTSVREAAELLRLRAAGGLNLKLGKLGGIAPARRIASLAAHYGVFCTAGATLQSSLIDAATAHFYASTHGVVRHEVKAPFLVSEQPVAGLAIEAGTLVLPSGPGLGVHVDEGALGNPIWAMP